MTDDDDDDDCLHLIISVICQL